MYKVCVCTSDKYMCVSLIDSVSLLYFHKVCGYFQIDTGCVCSITMVRCVSLVLHDALYFTHVTSKYPKSLKCMPQL